MPLRFTENLHVPFKTDGFRPLPCLRYHVIAIPSQPVTLHSSCRRFVVGNADVDFAFNVSTFCRATTQRIDGNGAVSLKKNVVRSATWCILLYVSYSRSGISAAYCSPSVRASRSSTGARAVDVSASERRASSQTL